MKLLIVDDSMIIRRGIAQFAERKGFEIVGEAGNGIEAIEIFQKNRPDAITMDITMPEMDGLECIRKIMQIDDTVNVVVISALIAQENMLDAMNAGAKGFIQKPFNDEKLEKVFEILSKNNDQ